MAIDTIRVLCVDDNVFVAEGIRLKLAMSAGFEWVGHLQTADDLVQQVEILLPDIVLLDIDMPGRDSLAVLCELSAAGGRTRTVIVSGYDGDDYLDRAIEAGAWGFVSKNEGPQAIVEAIRTVAAGHFAFGPMLLRQVADAMVE